MGVLDEAGGLFSARLCKSLLLLLLLLVVPVKGGEFPVLKSMGLLSGELVLVWLAPKDSAAPALLSACA